MGMSCSSVYKELSETTGMSGGVTGDSISNHRQQIVAKSQNHLRKRVDFYRVCN